MPGDMSRGMEIVLGLLLNIGISAAIGAFKRDVVRGLVWGLLLGPLGWLIVLLLPAGPKPKDEEFVSSVPDTDRGRIAREDRTPQVSKPNDKESCYLCGKRLEADEPASRVCRACR